MASDERKTDKQMFHLTALSNFSRGFDKYSKCYSKLNIPQSTFSDKFFLLGKNNLSPGLAKAERLVAKLALPGDRPIVLSTHVSEEDLSNDHATGVGQYVNRAYIVVDGAFFLEDGKLEPIQIEEAFALSLETLSTTLKPWTDLTPRTISILPIGQACQADCKFCFSKASVSSEYSGKIKDWDRIQAALQAAKDAGAERAVITGGGEPTLVKFPQLTQLISACGSQYSKVVLITNAAQMARNSDEIIFGEIKTLSNAGLSVLAVSRHHHDLDRNADIMGKRIEAERIAHVMHQNKDALNETRLRYICVLQKGGIETPQDVADYLTWAASQGVEEVNFKELYVSSTTESAYADLQANAYSAAHQVPLSVVLNFAYDNRWSLVGELPWGAPIFQGRIGERWMRIAAYTEPSVHWERHNGIARSWNLMSDGKLLASLEDMNSEIHI